jgi:hypothetical protein
MRWYWVGYSDSSAPRGKQAKGAAIVRAWGEAEAVADLRAVLIGEHPGLASWEAHVGLIPEEWGTPPAYRVADARLQTSALLDAREANDLARAWDPAHRGLAGAEDIKAAFLDDDAKPGDPLFGKRVR